MPEEFEASSSPLRIGLPDEDCSTYLLEEDKKSYIISKSFKKKNIIIIL